MWTIHPVLSRNITIRRVKIYSRGAMVDGVDPESSSDVLIENCSFDTGDDGTVIKSGRDTDGRRVGVPSENIVIRGNEYYGRWGAITVGSEMSGGAYNVFARRCRINAADFPGNYPVKYPLYIKTNKLRGGVIDGVHLRDFTGGNVEREALYVILNYNNEAGTRPVTVRDITVERMVLDGARRAVWLNGLETDPIRHVRVRDSHFTRVTNAENTIIHVEDLTFTNVTVNGVPVS
jgi:polygalacturonase